MKTLFFIKNAYSFCKEVIGVVKETKNASSPILVNNLGSHSVTNKIEFVNISDSEIRDIRVEIIGPAKKDCIWEYPCNENDRILVIPHLRSKEPIVVEMQYIEAQSANAEISYSWTDWLGKRKSQTTSIRLVGWNS